MTTLYSSVIKLVNLYPVSLTHLGGQHAHAAFLDLVRAVDAELSARLHNANARKPFTVSPLMGLPANRSGWREIWLREGWEYWLRVTILDEVLFQSFIEYFMNPGLDTHRTLLDQRGRGGLPQIRLGDAHFSVSEILTTPGSHPWAGCTTLQDLQKRLDEPAPASITLELHSPVSFSLGSQEGTSGQRYELIPYPKLVFGSLAAAWKALTGQNMVEAVEKHAEKCWQPVLHRLERKALTLHNHPQLGSVGRVEYQRISAEETPLDRAFSLLADLAFYTGLGRKTAQGMGMTRRVQQ
jgi:CRISPR-associated endoribonuclease Cas6